MRLSEFIHGIRILGKQQREIDNKRIELIDAYIAANREFQDGEKVKISMRFGYMNTEELYGYITGCRANTETGGLIYQAVKAKKDGTPSKNKIMLYNAVITKL